MIKLFKIFFFLTLITGLTVPIVAAEQTFFGEDAGLGEDTRLTSHPNSDAARTDFLSHLTGTGTEDFEGFEDGATAPLAISFSGAGTATLTGTGEINNVPTGTNTHGRFPISGDNYWDSDSGFTLSFSEPVAAFGFYAIDISDFNGQVTLSLVSGSTKTLTIPSTFDETGGSVLYYGVIDADNPFTSVTFSNTAPGTDFFGFDDMTIGSLRQDTPPENPPAVPEPSSLVIFGAALLGSGMLKLRKK